MKKTLLSLILSLVLMLSASIKAQENPRIKKETILENASDKSKAKKEFKTAEKYYKQGKGTYDEALKYYLRLYDYNNNIAALNYKIGICYLWASDKQMAINYLTQSDATVAKDYYLALGKANQYALQYPQAKEAFQNYYNSLGKWGKYTNKNMLDQLKKDCDFAEAALKNPTPVFITNLGPLVNTYYDDYGAVYSSWNSSIYFTSKRPKNEPTKRVSRFKFNERVLVTKDCLKKPSEEVFSIKKLNGIENNSVAGVNNKLNTIYYYKGFKQNGNIYTATIKNNKAKKNKRLKGSINHIAYKETTLSISDDGSAYFVSTRRRGEGGKDIWYAKQKGKNRFGKIKNLGPIINTPFDEEGVSVSADGNTLFFSSKGHNGMGGYDVYKSEKGKDGTWQTPVNLGYPINSPADELFYHQTPDPMVAMYSSVRASGLGGLDIYKIVKDQRIPFTLIGKLFDSKTNTSIRGQVSVFNEANELVTSAETDTITGLYKLTFEDCGKYTYQASAKGYAQKTDSLTCPSVRHTEITKDFSLIKLKSPFTISGTVRDTISGAALLAEISVYDSTADTLLTRQVTKAETGNYAITLADKYKVKLVIKAIDYFTQTDSLDTKLTQSNSTEKHYRLKTSKIYYALKGRVLEEETAKPIYGIVSMYHPNELLPFNACRSDSITGVYALQVDVAGPFSIEIKADGYFFANDSITFKPSDNLLIKKDYSLKKMTTGAKIVVQNILFNSGNSTLKGESFRELDKLASLLMDNNNIRIEVSGHTDNVGGSAINKKLSKARALSVMNYLVSKGVEQSRVEYEGYGFDEPIAPNTTEDGRAQNRRVEIKVIK